MTASSQLVAASYDRAASRFAAAADRHVYRRLAGPLVEAVSDVTDPHAGVTLDVAAGTGAVGRCFARTVALDISAEQLCRNDALHRVRGDGEDLPFRFQSFSAAVCGFGINHVENATTLVREMARVARVVGLSTWLRPEVPYEPKQVVFDVLAGRIGQARSATGALLDRYADAVGSVDAVAGLMRAAALTADVTVIEVEIPWPGADAYLDYRLSMPTSAQVVDDAELRAELGAALNALPPESLTWRPRVIIGVGHP